jgi:uncharacterized protein YjbJ (UPF0337 family)
MAFAVSDPLSPFKRLNFSPTAWPRFYWRAGLADALHPAPPSGRWNLNPFPFVAHPACFSRRWTMGELTDKVKGNVNEAVGRAKQQSDDPETRDEGAGQEVKGQAQQFKGAVKGAINRL